MTSAIHTSGGEPSSPTSTGLFRRLQQDDPAAWERFVHVYGPLVVRWCRAAGLGDHDAADVAQEVFRAVFVHAASLRHGGPDDTLRGWLRVVTRSKVNDLWRRVAREPAAEGGSEHQGRITAEPAADAGEESPAGESAGETSLVVHRALDLVKPAVEPRTWLAFWRTAVDGVAPKDVAAEVGMTAGAVRVAKSRVLWRLRRELEGLV